MKQIISLNNLKINSQAKILEVNNTGSIRRRLLDLGFIPGVMVSAILQSPFKDPIAYKINKIKDINTKALKIIKLFDQNTIYK